MILAIACAVFSGMLTLYLMPGLSLLAVGALPSSPYCSTWQAVLDANIKLRQMEAANQLRAQATVLREDDELTLWETPVGEWWVPRGDPGILPVLLAQQQRQIYGTGDRGVQPGNIVLDAGAHVGTYARSALDAGAAVVVAIEPSPQAVEALRRNFATEIAAGSVIVYPKGVWDREDTLTFYENSPGAAGDSFVVHNDASRAINMPVTTIDRIVDELELPRVDFIKADVKGATERMISGALMVMRRSHPRWAISTESRPEDPAAIARALSGYEAIGGPCFYTEGEIRTDVMFFR